MRDLVCNDETEKARDSAKPLVLQCTMKLLIMDDTRATHGVSTGRYNQTGGVGTWDAVCEPQRRLLLLWDQLLRSSYRTTNKQWYAWA